MLASWELIRVLDHSRRFTGGGGSIAAGTLDCTVLVVGISKDPSLSSISTGDQTPIIPENRHSNYFAGVLFVSWQRDDH